MSPPLILVGGAVSSVVLCGFLVYKYRDEIAQRAESARTHAHSGYEEAKEQLRQSALNMATYTQSRWGRSGEEGEKTGLNWGEKDHGNNVPDLSEKDILSRQGSSSTSTSSSTFSSDTAGRDGLHRRRMYSREEEEKIQDEHSHLSAMEQENERRRLQLVRENEALKQEEAVLQEKRRSLQMDSDAFASQSLGTLSFLHSPSSHTELEESVSLAEDPILFDAASTLLKEEEENDGVVPCPSLQHEEMEKASTLSDPDSWIDVDDSSSSSHSTASLTQPKDQVIVRE
ncbi:hypothetical protein BJ684DRAFT_16962 [Piptocephalis cylindrospora]|uniref:Uncharacterized protein n=1 Tax=Piptocephalis cylindrospora TaxID=1907219 RepID=A0A4P9Y1M8_9FUNG|nr:hypothetical protein BJ684DRAFT_16962 [Piptocephalis cylindrospora]|eukprot:RKP12564.1 hypothetical protein BJ684DRAFT_16962 [Piptocephalis cylindrospora]